MIWLKVFLWVPGDMVLECLWDPPQKKYGCIFFTWINPWCFWVGNFDQAICPNGIHSPTGTQIEHGYWYELGTRPPCPPPGSKKPWYSLSFLGFSLFASWTEAWCFGSFCGSMEGWVILVFPMMSGTPGVFLRTPWEALDCSVLLDISLFCLVRFGCSVCVSGISDGIGVYGMSWCFWDLRIERKTSNQ